MDFQLLSVKYWDYLTERYTIIEKIIFGVIGFPIALMLDMIIIILKITFAIISFGVLFNIFFGPKWPN